MSQFRSWLDSVEGWTNPGLNHFQSNKIVFGNRYWLLWLPCKHSVLLQNHIRGIWHFVRRYQSISSSEKFSYVAAERWLSYIWKVILIHIIKNDVVKFVSQAGMRISKWNRSYFSTITFGVFRCCRVYSIETLQIIVYSVDAVHIWWKYSRLLHNPLQSSHTLSTCSWKLYPDLATTLWAYLINWTVGILAIK